MKTHVLTVSRYFPATHNRKGEETNFILKIIKGTKYCVFCEYRIHNKCMNNTCETLYDPKLHTIRANYELWKKRIEEVQKGEAILSVRYWSGKPYNTKQATICNLTKDDGVGIQRLEFQHDRDGVYGLKYPIISRTSFGDAKVIATNDGLSFDDFLNWFRKYDLSKPLAIIHFTKFRY